MVAYTRPPWQAFDAETPLGPLPTYRNDALGQRSTSKCPEVTLRHTEALYEAGQGFGTHGTSIGGGEAGRESKQMIYDLPSLSEDEIERVSQLYYLTENIKENKDLRQHLHSILNLVKLATRYPGAFLGFMDVDAFVEMAAASRAMKTYPRRETICAHTILREPGTVYDLPDLENDIFFGQSPHVMGGGLRSYAGTQLCYTSKETGQVYALGTLCVNSTVKMPPLTSAQKDMLVGFAELAMRAIEKEATLTRQSSSTQMQALLVELSILLEMANSSHNALRQKDKREMAVTAMESVFPGCRCTCVATADGHLPVQGQQAPVAFSNFREGAFWEHSDAMNDYILHRNHLAPETEIWNGRSLRAVAFRLVEENEYLLVETNDIRRTFDEVDALFLRSVGLALFTNHSGLDENHASEPRMRLPRKVIQATSDSQHTLDPDTSDKWVKSKRVSKPTFKGAGPASPKKQISTGLPVPSPLPSPPLLSPVESLDGILGTFQLSRSPLHTLSRSGKP